MSGETANSSSRPNRRSTRLSTYDYSQAGAYFVTICTSGRSCLFGQIVDSEVQLTQFGKIADAEWLRSAEIRREVQLDEYIIMPNHIHGIVFIQPKAEAEPSVGRPAGRPYAAQDRLASR